MKLLIISLAAILLSCSVEIGDRNELSGIIIQPMNTTQLLEHYALQPRRIIGKSGSDPLLAVEHNDTLTPSDTLLLRRVGEDVSQSARRKWLKVTTIDPDRSGDVVIPSGGEYNGFRRNPQFLWQHGLTTEAVHTLGRILRLVVTDSAVFALAEYAPEGVSALADKIAALDEAGLVPANSIGFRPIEWKPNEHGGFTFSKWELVEISKVELPANPFATDNQ